MDLKSMTDKQLDDAFAAAQAQVAEAQAVQTSIDQERRVRYAAEQREVLERKRAELAAFEKSLEVKS